MEMNIKKYSGKVFSAEEMSLLKEIVLTYPKLSQIEIASTVCEVLEWTAPNGRPKRDACLAFLRKLESDGEISLPMLKPCGVKKGTRLKKHMTEDEDISWMDTRSVTECGALTLAIARPGESLRRWRAYIRAFHMLGDANVTGSRICYTVNSEGRDLGCVQFSASAWALEARDEFIGWTVADKKERLHLVLNNSRTLIFPWVRVNGLGSRILSLAAKQVARDWLNIYYYEPVLLETFVDVSFFRGTIYKASNWMRIGQTKGRGRNDRENKRDLSVKDIYLYPLHKDFREILAGKKPCKVRDPEDDPLR
ncbi:MAG: DUF4338 domain-containing protein [Betaproteobacteria bacterium]|nr:DUF4338 domain-containing protein [Betaproteobacteria bacterium]